VEGVKYRLTWATEQSVMLIDADRAAATRPLVALRPLADGRADVPVAADIIETSITTDWEAVARVGAIAVIRTFLNYFLERDFVDVHEQQEQARR